MRRSPVVLTLALLVGANPLAWADGLRGEQQLDDTISPQGDHSSAEVHLSTSLEIVHAVWQEAGVGASTSEDIWYRRSLDGGKSFQSPHRLDVDDLEDDIQPWVASSGTLVVVGWLSGTVQDVWVAVSDDSGLTFGAPRNISGALAGDAGDADNLRVDIAGDTVCLVFEDDIGDPALTEDVWVLTSTDRGATFGDPVRVDDAAGLTDVEDPEILVQSSAIFVVWIDERNGKDEVFFSKSTDSGLSFGANVRLDGAPVGADTDTPKIAARGSRVFVTWLDDRNVVVGDQAYFIRSEDSGATFEPEKVLGAIPVGTDVDDVGISLGSAGTVYVVWADNRNGLNDIFVTVSGDNGKSFDTEVVVDTDAGTVASDSPRIASRNEQVYIAFREDVSGGHQISLAFSPESGADGTWQVRRATETLADGSDADSHQIVVNKQRDVVLGWVDDRNGSGNPDNDVFVNGQRLPELTLVQTGNKLEFQLSSASPSEEGLFYLCVFSSTGTDWTVLPGPSGTAMCLTPDAFTFLMSKPVFLPIFGANIADGGATTVPIKIPFNGFAVGLVIDFGTLDFVAATDPVGF